MAAVALTPAVLGRFGLSPKRTSSILPRLRVWCVRLALIPILANPHRTQTYTGGPLSKVAGDKLVSGGVKLGLVYGGTECGVHTNILDVDDTQSSNPNAKTKEDWEWMTFPDYVKPRWVPQGDGTYELQFLVGGLRRLAAEEMLTDVCRPANNTRWP